MLMTGLEEHAAAYLHLPRGKLAASCGWGNRVQGITTAEPRISLFVTMRHVSQAAPKHASTPLVCRLSPQERPLSAGQEERAVGSSLLCSLPLETRGHQ